MEQAEGNYADPFEVGEGANSVENILAREGMK